MDGLIDDDEAHSIMAVRDDLWKAHRANMTDESAGGFESAMSRIDSAMDIRL